METNRDILLGQIAEVNNKRDELREKLNILEGELRKEKYLGVVGKCYSQNNFNLHNAGIDQYNYFFIHSLSQDGRNDHEGVEVCWYNDFDNLRIYNDSDFSPFEPYHENAVEITREEFNKVFNNAINKLKETININEK